MPTIQVRDMTVQKRENDLVLGDVRPRLLRARRLQRRCARSRRRRSPRTRGCSPLRDAYLFNPVGLAPAGTAGHRRRCPATGRRPNPPFGAVFTYNVKQRAARRREAGADDHRRHRPPDPPARRGQDAGPAPRRLEPARRAGGKRAADRARRRRRVRRPRRPAAGPLVTPGRYRATLGKLVGETVTPIGAPQSFSVVQLTQ